MTTALDIASVDSALARASRDFASAKRALVRLFRALSSPPHRTPDNCRRIADAARRWSEERDLRPDFKELAERASRYLPTTFDATGSAQQHDATPEQLALCAERLPVAVAMPSSLVIASAWQRVAGCAVDLAVIWIIGALTAESGKDPMWLAVFGGYYLLLETAFARTLGKLVARTHVVAVVDYGRPGFVRVLVRTAIRLFVYEVITFFGSDRPVGLHDGLAQTRVVARRQPGADPNARAAPLSPWRE